MWTNDSIRVAMLWKIIQIHAKQENCEINHVKMKLIFYCSGYYQIHKPTPPKTLCEHCTAKMIQTIWSHFLLCEYFTIQCNFIRADLIFLFKKNTRIAFFQSSNYANYSHTQSRIAIVIFPLTPLICAGFQFPLFIFIVSRGNTFITHSEHSSFHVMWQRKCHCKRTWMQSTCWQRECIHGKELLPKSFLNLNNLKDKKGITFGWSERKSKP